MRFVLVALLFAISCAQTEDAGGVTGALPRGQQAIRLADATGAKIDGKASVEATKNWLKEKQEQMAYLDNLQKQADGLTELVKKITDQRPVYASSVDRKNQADSSLEEESVNYLAAELMRLKKKVDQTITERDSIVDKYVPDLKKAMKTREQQLTGFWEGKQVDWKKEVADLHDNIAKLKEAQQAELNDKDKDLESERQAGATKLQEANDEAETNMGKLRGEMTKAGEDNTAKMQEVNGEMTQRDEKWKAQLQGEEEKNTKQYEANQAGIAAQNKKNEEKVNIITQKYEGEMAEVQEKLVKDREANKGKIEQLTGEKQDLQKEVIQNDAKQTGEIADLKKKQSDQRALDREAEGNREAGLVKKMNEEKTAALQAQAAANAQTAENISIQADQRMANLDETRQNERTRNKATKKRLKQNEKAEQGRTDAATEKLRTAKTQLNDLQAQMSAMVTNTASSAAAYSGPTLESEVAASEKDVALQTQANANKQTVENLEIQSDQRMQNAEESAKNERARSDQTKVRFKDSIKAEQKRTDVATDKLRDAETQLDELRTKMSTVSQSAMTAGAAITSPLATSETEVAVSDSSFSGLDMRIVGGLVTLNLFLGSLALMYYYDSAKAHVNHQAGLLEEF